MQKEPVSYTHLDVYKRQDGLCSADVMSVLRTTDETIYCYCDGGGLCKLVSSNLLSDELRFRSFGKETSPLDVYKRQIPLW